MVEKANPGSSPMGFGSGEYNGRNVTQPIRSDQEYTQILCCP